MSWCEVDSENKIYWCVQITEKMINQTRRLVLFKRADKQQSETGVCVANVQGAPIKRPGLNTCDYLRMKGLKMMQNCMFMLE